jgi:hypothetical protein
MRDRTAPRRVDSVMRLACLLLLATTPALADTGKPKVQVRTGTLVDMHQQTPHCGDLMVWTIVHFDFSKDRPSGQGFKPERVPVAIACIELSRKQMGPGAGNAGPVATGKRYTVSLGTYGKGSWGAPAFEAVKIDDAP